MDNFEGNGADPANPMRNYILDDNSESALRVTDSNQFTRYYWSASASAWQTDSSADSQAAKAGETSQYTDYEFKVQRAGGADHINAPKGALLGFLIRYHDAARSTDALSNFFWEYTTNNDAQLLDNQSSAPVYIATGWANLQLGGPYIQVVTPASGDNISGLVPVKISSGKDSLKSVVAFLSTDTTSRTSLSYEGAGVWTGTVNATNAPKGTMLIIEAVAANGVTYERIVNKADTSAVIVPPGVVVGRMFGATVVGQSGHSVLFLVTLERRESFDVEVYSINGRKMLSRHIDGGHAGANKIDFDEAVFANGTYLLSVNGGGKRTAQRFAIIR